MDTYSIKNLTLADSLEQARDLYRNQEKNINLNFSDMNSVRSAGMIIFASCVQDLRKSHNFTLSNADSTHGCSYAEQMGFFDALGFPGHKKVGSFKGNGNYRPITRLTVKHLILSYPHASDFYPGLIDYSKGLAGILSKENDEETNNKLSTFLQYSIREIIRNTYEHTSRDYLFIAAQRHQQENTIELVISDDGQGIRQTLSVNPDLGKLTDIDALTWAVKPGVSEESASKLYLKRNRTKITGNSGYGLYVTAKLFSKIGNMTLISGNAIYDSSTGTATDLGFSYPGTAVILRVNIDNLFHIDEDAIDSIVHMGEKEAKTIPYAHKTASMSSRMY